MNEYKAKGIVLKASKWKEADLIVSVLLTNGSAKSFVAKNALKSKKRFGGGVLEPSHYIQFTYNESRLTSYLKEASIINDFSSIRTSFELLKYAMDGIQFLSKSIKENLEDESIFHLMGNYLNSLVDEKQAKLLYLHFRVRLLMIMGILPNEVIYQEFTGKELSQNEKIQISEEEIRNIEFSLKALMSDYY